MENEIILKSIDNSVSYHAPQCSASQLKNMKVLEVIHKKLLSIGVLLTNGKRNTDPSIFVVVVVEYIWYSLKPFDFKFYAISCQKDVIDLIPEPVREVLKKSMNKAESIVHNIWYVTVKYHKINLLFYAIEWSFFYINKLLIKTKGVKCQNICRKQSKNKVCHLGS